MNALRTAAASLFAAAAFVTAAHAGKPEKIAAPPIITGSAAPDADLLAAAWVDAKRQEMLGLEAEKDAAKALRKAEKAEARASKKLEKARAAAADRREHYRTLVGGFGVAETPDAVEAEIRALKKAQDAWSDAAKDVDKALEAYREARADIDAATSALRAAREMIETSRQKMQEAEHLAAAARPVQEHADLR